jgi:hypothetical protein
MAAFGPRNIIEISELENLSPNIREMSRFFQVRGYCFSKYSGKQRMFGMEIAVFLDVY